MFTHPVAAVFGVGILWWKDFPLQAIFEAFRKRRVKFPRIIAGSPLPATT
jgi:hypothetical protein